MDPASQGGNQASSKGKGESDEDDPLALIRREIAVMKKLECVAVLHGRDKDVVEADRDRLRFLFDII